MEKTDENDNKKLLMLGKKLFIKLAFLIVILFLVSKIGDYHTYLNQKEIDERQNIMMQSAHDILMPNGQPLVSALAFKARGGDAVWAENRFIYPFSAKSVLAYYRAELLKKGWSELEYEAPKQEKVGDRYISIKGNYVISFYFPMRLNDPSLIPSKFNGHETVDFKPECFIRITPITKEYLPKFDD